MKELLKYLPLLMRYAQYLKYIPFAVELVSLVKQAERKFREAKSGAQRLEWAREQFSALVAEFEEEGLISTDTAAKLRDGVEGFLSAIVTFMNAFGGVPIDDDGDGNTGSPAAPLYLVEFDLPVPSDEELKSARHYGVGDSIVIIESTNKWLVIRKNSPTLGMTIARPIQ